MYYIFRGIRFLFNAYRIILVLYALLSWFPTARQSSLANIIAQLTEPYLKLFQRFRIGNLGFSVIIGLIVLRLVEAGVIQILRWLFF